MAEAFPITATRKQRALWSQVLAITCKVFLLVVYVAPSEIPPPEGPTASPNSSTSWGVSTQNMSLCGVLQIQPKSGRKWGGYTWQCVGKNLRALAANWLWLVRYKKSKLRGWGDDSSGNSDQTWVWNFHSCKIWAQQHKVLGEPRYRSPWSQSSLVSFRFSQRFCLAR